MGGRSRDRALFALVLGLWCVAEAKSEGPARIRREVSSLSKVAKDALPAVVAITTKQPRPDGGGDEETGLGAGFVVSTDGYILTAAHVIRGAREVRVKLWDEDAPSEFTAEIVGADVETDLALLRVDVGRPLPALPLGSSESLEIADWVVSIGNPFGLAHSVTVGVVSHKGRQDVAPGGVESLVDLLQTDASINPGSSGGPLLDLEGRVVGIANAVNVSGQGIGFATPVEVAKAVLPQLRAHGGLKRGWLGISVQDLTPELAHSFGLARRRGVLVSDVIRGGPGDRAGLKVGDVILRVDDSHIARANALRWAVGSRGAGRAVRVLLERGGETLVRSVELEDAPSPTEPSRRDSRLPSPTKER